MVLRFRQAGDRAVLALLFTSFLVVAIDGQALSPLFPLLGRQFGVDPGRAVLVTGSFQVALLLSPLLARWSHGRSKAFLLAGMAVFAAGCWLAGAAVAFSGFLGARFTIGLASAFFLPAVGAYVGDRFPYALRGRAMAAVRSAWSLAGVAGIPLAARVAERVGITPLFGALALAGAAMLILLGLLLPPPPPPAPRSVTALRSSGHWTVLVVAALWIMGPCSVFYFLAAHLEGRFTLPTTAIGAVFSLCAAAGLVGNLVSGWGADRWGKRTMVVLGLVLMAAALAALPHAPTLGAAVLLAAGMTLALETGWTSFQTLAGELQPRARGEILAAANLGYGLGSIVMAGVAPWLWGMGGFGGALTLGLVATFAALALTLGCLPAVPGDGWRS